MNGPILCLVDIAHADSAVSLLDYAAALAMDREIHVAYVMPYGFYSYVEPYVSEESQKAAADRAHSELDALLDRLPSLTATPHVLRGGIGDQAIGLAQRLGVSAIFLNAVRADSNHGTLGTHAAQIARHAPCTVHLVRHT